MTGVKVTEDDLTASILELAELLGWICYHPRPARTDRGWRTPGQGNGAAGFPDLVLGHGIQGRLIFAELKSATGKTSLEQDEWLRVLHRGPAEVYLWTPEDWTSGRVEQLLRAPP